jgi:hypothetical protein
MTVPDNGAARLKSKQLFEYEYLQLLETSGGQSPNQYLNVAHFYNQRSAVYNNSVN